MHRPEEMPGESEDVPGEQEAGTEHALPVNHPPLLQGI